MGLPSLLEDIVQKQIDDLLQAELPTAQIYTREELKDVLVHLGVKARSLLSVSDEQLIQISELFAKENQELRVTLDNLKREQQELLASKINLEAELKAISKNLSITKKKYRQVERQLRGRLSELLQRDEYIRSLKEEISQMKAEMKAERTLLNSQIEGLRTLRKFVDGN